MPGTGPGMTIISSARSAKAALRDWQDLIGQHLSRIANATVYTGSIDQHRFPPHPSAILDLRDHESRDAGARNAARCANRSIVGRSPGISRRAVCQTPDPHNGPVEVGSSEQPFHLLLVGNFISKHDTEQQGAHQPSGVGAWLATSALVFGVSFFAMVGSTTALVRFNYPPAAWPAAIAAMTIRAKMRSSPSAAINCR